VSMDAHFARCPSSNGFLGIVDKILDGWSEVIGVIGTRGSATRQVSVYRIPPVTRVDHTSAARHGVSDAFSGAGVKGNKISGTYRLIINQLGRSVFSGALLVCIFATGSPSHVRRKSASSCS